MQEPQQFSDRKNMLKRRHLELDERKISIDEKGPSVKGEERRAQINKQTKFDELLGALVRKLN